MIEALIVALPQGTLCTEATFQDSTDYATENIPAQRRKYQLLTPANTAGKTAARFTFTSGATNILISIPILSGDTVAQKCTKIAAGINANTTIAAIVTAVAGATFVTVTADADDVNFNFVNEIEGENDNVVIITNYPASTRTITFEYSDGTVEIVPFPYPSGNEYTLEPLAKDFTIKVTMTITPQVVVSGSVYVSIIIPVFACFAYTCKGVIASNYRVDMQNMIGSNPKLDTMSAMDACINAAQYAASTGDVEGSQVLLDQANALCAL
jgi:hypothetical protein